MQGPGSLICTALLLSLVACAAGCAKQGTETPPTVVDRPLPTPPPAGEIKFAGVPPAHPFAKQAGNYYGRTVFETDGPNNSHIEVRDILIPPHAKSALEALPGPAVMDPAGAAKVTLSIADKPESLAEGTMRSLPAGQAIALENSDARPAMVRLYIFRSR
jgi:hypothetical protein